MRKREKEREREGHEVTHVLYMYVLVHDHSLWMTGLHLFTGHTITIDHQNNNRPLLHYSDILYSTSTSTCISTTRMLAQL